RITPAAGATPPRHGPPGRPTGARRDALYYPAFHFSAGPARKGVSMSDDLSKQKVASTDVTATGTSRRNFLAAGTGLTAAVAALAAGGCATASTASSGATTAAGRTDPERAPKPPFDSIRDYVAALEAHDLL